MNFERINNTTLLIYLNLIISIALGLSAIALSLRIDTLINEDLYNFNLQFNSAWYDPYSLYSKLILASLGLLAASNMALLILNLVKKQNKMPNGVNRFVRTPINTQKEVADSEVETKVIPKASNNPLTKAVSKVKEKAPSQTDSTQARKIVEDKKTLGTCLKCGKSFSQPLVTLDFIDGKAVKVNTCPYCYEPTNS